MRTMHFRALATGALTLLTLVGGVAVAQNTPPGLLNALEVQQLVKRSDPVDNARLATHFSVLAERYTAEAARHTAMAQSFTGNPNHDLGAGASAHCKRLAELSTQSATTVRELVFYHQKLAAGASSVPPSAGSGFEGGGGAARPTQQELRAMAKKAGTPADHHALEEYFLTQAERYTAHAADHVRMAQAYRGTKIAQSASHCDRLVELLRASAKEATAAADMQKQLAGLGRR